MAMIMNNKNTLIEFDEEELKVLKFFLENSFKTLSELINDPMIDVEFVFPGIFSLDKIALTKVLNKVQEFSVNTYQIDAHNIKKEDFSFDNYMK